MPSNHLSHPPVITARSDSLLLKDPLSGIQDERLWRGRTFKMKENVGLVVLEHLRNQFHIHVLDVHFLE